MLTFLSLCFLLLTLWLLWSLLGVIVPIRPFRSRRRAGKSALATFAISMAAAVAIGAVSDKGGSSAPGPRETAISEPPSTKQEGSINQAAAPEEERPVDGQRIFVADDFYWDEDTSGHKDAIVAVVNRIARENASCGTIDPGSVAKSPSRSKPGDPVFFVTCGEGFDAFNVWFRPADATGAKKFAAVKPLDRAQATEACEQAARNAATHPSTVDFSQLWDLAYVPHASGRATVLSSFTAKNAFGLELKYEIKCLFEGTSLIETQISEATD